MVDPRAELADPATTPQRLAELAQQHPEYGPWIAAHPNAYPGLQAWIAQYATPQAPAQPAKTKLTALWISLAAVLVLLLAIGGTLWWVFGSKLGGSPTPEAAATKLITSVSSLDPLSLTGSLAPSEFGAFEQASKNLLATQTDDDTQTAEQFLGDLKREVTVSTTTPLETRTETLVDGEVERVIITDGVIEIDGDPAKVADLIVDFYGPVAQAQSESFGTPLSRGDLDDAREEIEHDLRDALPYEIDFSDLGFDLTLVSVKEGGSWYVSPILTFADIAHQESGASDRVLGDEIIAPEKHGAASPEEAATRLTEAIVDGNYDAVAAQMPLPERRLLSIYGESFTEQTGLDLSGFDDADSDTRIELDDATYRAQTDGGTARVTIDRLAFLVESYDFWTDSDLTQFIEISGTCVVVKGERLEYIDYWGEEYDDLWNEWWRDLDYPGSYSDWLFEHGYDEYEVTTEVEEFCLADEAPLLDDLGVDDWALIAVHEDGAWKISPLGTVADIAAIITDRVNQAAREGELDSLFT